MANQHTARNARAFLDAVARNRPVTFRYRDAHGDVTVRSIRPLPDTGAYVDAVGRGPGYRYVRAWCDLRGDVRAFRPANVVSIVSVD